MTRAGESSARFWSAGGSGVDLRVRLTPNGGRDEIKDVLTLADGRQVLTAKVRAIPQNGRANAALEKLIAKAIGVAPARVEVAAGKSGRIKTVKIAGDGAELIAAVTALPHNQ